LATTAKATLPSNFAQLYNTGF